MITDVESFLAKHGVYGTKRGNELKIRCLNPNHHDHKPSCYINVINGEFHCFACGFSGGIKKLERIFSDKSLSQYNVYTNSIFNMDVYVNPIKPEPVIIGTPKELEGKSLEFFYSIGGTDEFAKEYEVKDGYYLLLTNTDLQKKGQWTVINNRLMFPIYNENNKLASYEARTYVGDEPKVLYAKDCGVDFVFNINKVDKNKPVILTESIKNLMKGWQVNKNIVSTFGNQISDHKAELLNTIPEIILYADYDKGGITMLKKLMTVYKGTLSVCTTKGTYVKNGKIKGYDMNDTSLEDIYKNINNTISPKEFLNIYENKITW